MPRPVIFLLLVISIVAYVIGITQPVATVHKNTLIIKQTNQYSIMTTISDLHSSDEKVLAFLIALFSIAFPLAKYSYLIFVLFSRIDTSTSRLFRIVQRLGKWSMMDVFVVALLIVMMRINGNDHWYLSTKMETEPGLFVFAFSVISAMFLTSRIGSLGNK